MTFAQKQELKLIIQRLSKMDYNGNRIKQILVSKNLYFNFTSPMIFVKKNLGYKVLEYVDWLEETK